MSVAKSSSSRQRHRARLTFFDVDRTLIGVSSLAGFFAELKRTHPEKWLCESISALERSAAGRDHAELVVDAIGLLRGQSWEYLDQIGESWFAREGRAAFVPEVCDRLRWHQDRGDRIVLVSGSWPSVLAPIARALDVPDVLCCEPETTGDRLKGSIRFPVLGAGKVRAISEFVEKYHLTLLQSTAYGDDPSDVLMLELVEHPVVVGDEPFMVTLAAERRWAHLATTVRRH